MLTRSPSSGRVVGVIAVALLLVAVAVVATGAVAPESTLVVTDEDGEELIATPVSEDTEVVIEYTHSVEKTLVQDVYAPSDGKLVMTRMEFSSFGAGLPAQADVTERGGRYVYHPPRTEHETLHLKTGHVADHDLVVGDERYDVASMTDGGAVELTVQQRRRIPL